MNNSRNLALKLNAIVENPQEKVFFSKMISNYAFSLKNHLINRTSINQVERLEGFDIEKLDKSKHMPMQLLNALF